MRNFNPFAGRPRSVLLAPVDGAAGGGADADGGAESADAGDAGDDETQGDDDAGEAGDDEGRGAQTDREDDDDDLVFGRDDDNQDDRPLDERHKALGSAHNKLKRRYGKALPTLKALKKAGVEDVDDLLRKGRSFDALMERAGGDPDKLIRLLQREMDDRDDDGARRETRAADGERRLTKAEARDIADEFDLSDEQFAKLWATDNETGKFFIKLSRSHGATARALKDANARLDRLEGGIRQKDEITLRKEWVSVIDAGAKKITNEGLRTAYSDLMKAAYREGGAKFDARAVSAKVLKNLGVNPQTARIVQGAQQQRMAQQNGKRPQHQAGGHGSQAAPARAKRETVADVSRRIRTS